MTSQEQHEASRINPRKSTGQRSVAAARLQREGKLVSHRNALKSGRDTCSEIIRLEKRNLELLSPQSPNPEIGFVPPKKTPRLGHRHPGPGRGFSITCA